MNPLFAMLLNSFFQMNGMGNNPLMSIIINVKIILNNCANIFMYNLTN